MATALALVALVTGCTSGGDEVAEEQPAPTSPRAATEALITGPMAEAIGLGPLSASCPEMTGATVGQVFQCSATTVNAEENQNTIEVAAEILASGQVDLSTTNVVTAEALTSFEQAAVDALNTTLEDPLPYDNMDCGQNSLVLSPDRTLTCGLLDPATDDVFDVTLSISDLEGRQFALAVAEVPRR